MRARSIAIHDVFQLKSFSDLDLFNLTTWLVRVGGKSVNVTRHNDHIHVKGEGIEFDIFGYDFWFVYSGGLWFAFTNEEFTSSYEIVDEEREEERTQVQIDPDFSKGAKGTIFQALVNSGLSRDQALDGLIEILKTGVFFADQKDIPKSDFQEVGVSDA
jgi:hypothetical protein